MGQARTICLAGHSGCGKTTLALALMKRAGVKDQILFDASQEEKERGCTIDMGIGAFQVDGVSITLLDTPGAYPGLEAEERGQAEAIARNLFEMARLRVPIVVAIIGEGASGGALGLGVGDRILMMENSWYSVISPESCSSILWRSWEFKEQAAEALQLTAPDLKKQGIIDDIVPEPKGGAHRNPEQAARVLKETLLQELKALAKVKPEKFLERRIEKFSKMGVWVG